MKRILAVDDDIDILDAIRLPLEEEGYQVMTSKKGKYPDDLYNKKVSPDVIILDVFLSGKDGRKICRNLKNRKETKHIPIIMMSGYPDVRKSSLQSGADFFLEKPFDIGELLRAVAGQVEK